MSLTRHEHRHGVSVQTSVRIWGEQQIDEFEALCLVLGRRPHELAADMVLEVIRKYREDPEVGAAVDAAVAARRHHRAEGARARASTESWARGRNGLHIVKGGAS